MSDKKKSETKKSGSRIPPQLIGKDLSSRSPEELRKIQSKGGATRSQGKVEAAKFREIKKAIKRGAIKTRDPDWLLEQLNNSNAMAADIMAYIDEVKEDVHPAQRVALINARNNVMKTIHGEKIKTENVNINIETNVDEWEKRMMDLEDDEE